MQPGYMRDYRGTTHVIDPCQEEFTLCSLAFDIGSDDYDDSGRRGMGPMQDCDGPCDCKECKERSELLISVLPYAKWA